MKLRVYDPKIIAIHLRHRRFGYAVYEGHRGLLDWGVRVYPAIGEEEVSMASKRLSLLLRLHSPSVIVLKQERWDLAQTNQHMRVLVEMTRDEAIAHSVQIRLLRDAKVKESFRHMGCETRSDIAEALARIFPELTSYVPPKRRTWQAEHPRMIVFDAIALGLAHWHHPCTESPNLFEGHPQSNS